MNQASISNLESERVDIKSYALVTAAYWGFTLTDGALRMLVLLYFHGLGYNALQVAALFLFYEFFGMVTNLIGGWIGSRFGLKITLFSGLAIQIGALVMLALLPTGWAQWSSVLYIMCSQALSGIAKDLTKMSSKSAIKLVVPPNAEGALFKWVAILTGSKNALKGVGFFLGGLLLSAVGFQGGLWLMAGGLSLVLLFSLLFLRKDMGKSKQKVTFSQLLSKSEAINRLSAARFFLFGARDVWFVVGLPLYLNTVLGWSYTSVGTFFALWVIGYGIIQSSAPALIGTKASSSEGNGSSSTAAVTGQTATKWVSVLTVITLFIALLFFIVPSPSLQVTWLLVVGLAIFGGVFAINSSIHSFLILALTDDDQVALNVGFYYMANAGGRLLGTISSGLLYMWVGLLGTLWGAVLFLLLAWLFSARIPQKAHSN